MIEINSTFKCKDLVFKTAVGNNEVGLMVTPPLNENYWIARVKLSPTNAVVCFPKFGTIGVGCQVEKYDWNTNLPWTCSARKIYNHIRKNAPRVKSAKFIAAIEELQAYLMKKLGYRAFVLQTGYDKTAQYWNDTTKMWGTRKEATEFTLQQKNNMEAREGWDSFWANADERSQ